MAILLEKGTPLPELGNEGFTISTYNVLLPNSSDGWWIYKCYQKHVPMEQRQWKHRSGLIKANILSGFGGADIVCLQETAADSFDTDFSFMKDEGYDHVLHSKFRFRVATFFKRDKFDLKSEKHSDRTLTTLLAFKECNDTIILQEQRTALLFVVNCHLTGGSLSPDKRMRQIHDATEYIRKEIHKMKPVSKAAAGGKKGVMKQDDVQVSAPGNTMQPRVVLCGDFNEDGDTATKKLLFEGLLPAGYTDKEGIFITTKQRKQELGLFRDAHNDAYFSFDTARPPTLICPNLIEHFVIEDVGVTSDGSITQQTNPTPKFVEAVKKAWAFLTQGSLLMNREAMEEWLVRINGQCSRGSEFRNAMRVLEEKNQADSEEDEQQHMLTFDDFLGLYMSELRGGKFWGVDHDLRQALDCPVEGAGEGPSFQAVYDYIYYGPGLQLEAIREELTKEELARALQGGDPLPNAWQPSDHVLQTAAFRFD